MQVVLVNRQDPKERLFPRCCQALGRGSKEDIVMQITTFFQEKPCFNLILWVITLAKTTLLWILRSTWDVHYLWYLSNTVLRSRYISDGPCLRLCTMAIVKKLAQMAQNPPQHQQTQGSFTHFISFLCSLLIFPLSHLDLCSVIFHVLYFFSLP